MWGESTPIGSSITLASAAPAQDGQSLGQILTCFHLMFIRYDKKQWGSNESFDLGKATIDAQRKGMGASKARSLLEESMQDRGQMERAETRPMRFFRIMPCVRRSEAVMEHAKNREKGRAQAR